MYDNQVPANEEQVYPNRLGGFIFQVCVCTRVEPVCHRMRCAIFYVCSSLLYGWWWRYTLGKYEEFLVVK